MRKMYSENQIIELIQKFAPEVTPEDIQKMFNDGDVSLDGKYVKVIDAPSSTNLTDEQIALFEEGVFINGTYLSLLNPVFFPAYSSEGSARGIAIGNTSGGNTFVIKGYYINKSNKTISTPSGNPLVISVTSNNSSITNFNNKSVPAYPSPTGTFVLKSVNGTLTWVEEVAPQSSEE